jgi:hypothetical protein
MESKTAVGLAVSHEEEPGSEMDIVPSIFDVDFRWDSNWCLRALTDSLD